MSLRETSRLSKVVQAAAYCSLVVASLAVGCSKANPPSPIAQQPAVREAAAFDPNQPLPKQTCKLFANLRAPSAKLSQSGCVDPKQPKRPASSLIPYAVNSPLWSDGADKLRFLSLPNGGKVQVKDCQKDPLKCDPTQGTPTVNGDWDLPVGTVLMKTFLIAGRFVETRLLMRYNRDTWAGYSYAWNEAQTDADVLPDALAGVERRVPTKGGSQPWHFPSRSECFQCHTGAAGVSLGLETAQLDRPFRYSATETHNQLEVLSRLGAFEKALPNPRPEAYADPGDPQANLSRRVRSYLHANCAVCHTPGGRFDTLDLRFTADLSETGLCNEEPRAQGGTLGVAGARLLVPGDPRRSVLSLRMHSTPGAFRMPPLASARVDPLGTQLIDSWISSLKNCM